MGELTAFGSFSSLKRRRSNGTEHLVAVGFSSMVSIPGGKG